MSIYFTSAKVPRIAALGGGEWDLQNLNQVTILFGKNGSGKSLLLRAWRDKDPRVTHYVAPERTGEINFDANQMQRQIEPQGRRESSTRNFAPDYRTQVVSRIQSYFLARGDHRKDKLPGDPSELEEYLSQLVPDFSVTIQARTPPYRLIRLSNNEQVGGVDQLSSGEAQLFTVALDIMTIAAIWELEAKHEKVLLIDEPDAHIHPDLQIRFADFLLQIAKRFDLQVVVATHSTTLLSAIGQFGGAQTSVIYLDRILPTLLAQPFDSVLKELAACLGGHALMGPLFAAPLMLVEGDDDYRIWSQVPRHHVVRLSVIPANGDEIKRYQKTLERIFSSLKEPGTGILGYALLDGDKALPTATPDAPQNFIRFLKLSCRESENLYLSDEVLSDLSLNWSDAASKIVQDSANYGLKKDLLAQASSWDRNSVDIKNLTNEISKILDPKNVHWTIRVGTRIGKERPKGDLASMLGDQLITALWGQPPNQTAGSAEEGHKPTSA